MSITSSARDDDVRALSFRARLRAAGVDPAKADQLLEEWRAVAQQRELDPDDGSYWSAAADWLLVRVSPTLGRGE